jgi:CHRD domain
MRTSYRLSIGSFLLTAVVAAPAVLAQTGPKKLGAALVGFDEVSSISTPAGALFLGLISQDEMSIAYRLQYANLEGAITQSHIHLGQSRTNGGISVWLCDTATNPSPLDSTPACPDPTNGTVTGLLTPDDVIGPNGQGIAPGEFAELIRAIRAGAAYANVHSTKYPSGEIRGQVVARN